MPLNLVGAIRKDAKAAMGKLSRALRGSKQQQEQLLQESDPPGLLPAAAENGAPVALLPHASSEEVLFINTLTQQELEDEELARQLQREEMDAAEELSTNAAEESSSGMVAAASTMDPVPQCSSIEQRDEVPIKASAGPASRLARRIATHELPSSEHEATVAPGSAPAEVEEATAPEEDSAEGDISEGDTLAAPERTTEEEVEAVAPAAAAEDTAAVPEPTAASVEGATEAGVGRIESAAASPDPITEAGEDCPPIVVATEDTAPAASELAAKAIGEAASPGEEEATDAAAAQMSEAGRASEVVAAAAPKVAAAAADAPATSLRAAIKRYTPRNSTVKSTESKSDRAARLQAWRCRQQVARKNSNAESGEAVAPECSAANRSASPIGGSVAEGEALSERVPPSGDAADPGEHATSETDAAESSEGLAPEVVADATPETSAVEHSEAVSPEVTAVEAQSVVMSDCAVGEDKTVTLPPPVVPEFDAGDDWEASLEDSADEGAEAGEPGQSVTVGSDSGVDPPTNRFGTDGVEEAALVAATIQAAAAALQGDAPSLEAQDVSLQPKSWLLNARSRTEVQRMSGDLIKCNEGYPQAVAGDSEKRGEVQA